VHLHSGVRRGNVIEVAHAGGTRLGALKMMRGACILEALRHPGVLRVYESGVLEDRRPWFARERVSGVTLASVLTPGVVERADAVAMFRDIASVLDHAHRRGVVHCDLSPSRVILTDRSRGFPLCLADWSCARMHDAASLSHTVTPASWLYTAPELTAGEPVDERVDVFALGVIAYQMLTGTDPYEEPPIEGATYAIPAALRCSGLPEELTDLIDRMVAFSRDDRPGSTEVHDAFAMLAAQLAHVTHAASPRIRRPRWTPPIAFDDMSAVIHDRPPTDPCVPLPIGDDGLSTHRE
jgi:serine/threonine protein kinase